MSFTLPSSAVADLSDRAIFSISGPDALRYLNGQISQDVSLASSTEAVYSIVANFKGKLDGDCYVRKHEDAILIDCSADQRESLFARLDRYLIADDAELTDISDQYSLYHSLGDHSEASSSWKCDRYGVEGIDILLPKDESFSADITPHSEWEKLRISNSIPSWGHELTTDTLPPEAKLESRAISYTKGCYTGQEVISRMRSAGKTNRHLVSFKVDNTLETPCDIFSPENTEKPAGEIASICKIDDQLIGLGYRKRKFESLESFQTSNGIPVQIV